MPSSNRPGRLSPITFKQNLPPLPAESHSPVPYWGSRGAQEAPPGPPPTGMSFPCSSVPAGSQPCRLQGDPPGLPAEPFFQHPRSKGCPQFTAQARAVLPPEALRTRVGESPGTREAGATGPKDWEDGQGWPVARAQGEPRRKLSAQCRGDGPNHRASEKDTGGVCGQRWPRGLAGTCLKSLEGAGGQQLHQVPVRRPCPVRPRESAGQLCQTLSRDRGRNAGRSPFCPAPVMTGSQAHLHPNARQVASWAQVGLGGADQPEHLLSGSEGPALGA